MSLTKEFRRKNGAAALKKPATIELVLNANEQAIEKFTDLRKRVERLEKATEIDPGGAERLFDPSGGRSRK